MNRISTKMKLLSLAILGLGGLALAGSASAACPATPDAWSVTAALGGGQVHVVSGGLDGSSCKMSASLGTSLASQASVVDTSPSNEPRYRFQFLIDPSNLGTFGNLDSVSVFAANSQATYPSSGGTKKVLSVGVVPASGGAKRLAFVYACDNGSTNTCLAVSSANLASGVNRIEVDMQFGSSGSIRYWMNAAAGSSEPTPTGNITGINNAGWVGVDIASLGLGSPSPSFASGHSSQDVYFDTFDSRRQTYIGH